jgi:outer membrane protein OmpA-like peptidoglycan-associated protein
MNFLYTQLNTLSVPKRCLAALILFAAGNMATAGIQHYQAPLDNVSWETTSKKLYCALSHDIPLYGRATFAQDAGGELGFKLTVKRKASRDKDRAHLRAQPPKWKHQISVVDLGEVAVHKGNTPFQLKEDLSRRLLAELQKGMFPTFSYRDWADARDQVTVALPGINIKPVLDEFIACLTNLPIYKFADFKINLLHFAFGKHALIKKDRQRLDAVARYLKSDPTIKQVVISGHTDNVGRKRNNDKLGKRRSKAVKDYLAAKGVSTKLFKIKTHGERKPITTNRTNKGRAKNRRAMVTLIR